MLVLLAAAAALSSTPAPAATPASKSLDAYVAREMAWEKANLDTSGWKLVTVGADVLVFLGPEPRAPSGDPMVAVRGEHYPLAQTNAIGAGQSFLSRDEIDCAGRRERTVSSTIFTDNGLQGNIASASDEPGAWNTIKEATFMAVAEASLCPAHDGAAPAGAHPPPANPPPAHLPQGHPPQP